MGQAGSGSGRGQDQPAACLRPQAAGGETEASLARARGINPVLASSERGARPD